MKKILLNLTEILQILIQKHISYDNKNCFIATRLR